MKVLVVDDDIQNRTRIANLVEAQGYECLTAVDGRDALEKLGSFAASVIVTDLRMPRMDGLELMKHLRAENMLPPTILMTAFGSVEMAISVVHDLGGFWFLEKPIDQKSLTVLLQRAQAHGSLENDNRELRRQLSFQGAMGELKGSSKPMQNVFAQIRRVAPTNAPVLLLGESGTGKELAARAIHSSSKRAAKPFVAVNCAAIPETLIESEIFGHEKGSFTGAVERRPGCLELADSGTLFLDELAEMPVQMQAKLLRVLEDFRYRRLGGKTELSADVRVVAATNQVPLTAIREGKLREDLYYRLNVFAIELPPLRDRMDDLPGLVQSLIERANMHHGTKVAGFQPEVIRMLESRRWEGNVRELRNVVERAVIMAGQGDIEPGMIAPAPTVEIHPRPANGGGEGGLSIAVGLTIDQAEQKLIEATLSNYSNKTKAAAILGISTKTLHAKLKQYGFYAPH